MKFETSTTEIVLASGHRAPVVNTTLSITRDVMPVFYAKAEDPEKVQGFVGGATRIEGSFNGLGSLGIEKFLHDAKERQAFDMHFSSGADKTIVSGCHVASVEYDKLDPWKINCSFVGSRLINIRPGTKPGFARL